MDLEDVKPKGAKRAKRITSTNKVALGATGVVSLFGIGSTLASNITLNGGGNVEFGQGVAHQVACDSDGFTVTPEGYFDNRADGVFRLKDIKVSGLDLSPIGANYLNSGEDFTNDASGLAAAKVAHPGQYWNNTAGAWRPTCDGVVLDFQMYTNNPDYVQYTYNAYEVAHGRTTTQTGINSPLMWVQETLTDGTPRLVYGSQGMWSYDAAVAYKWNGSYYESNYGTGHVPYGRNYAVNYPENLDVTAGTSDASFDIQTSGNSSSGSVGSSRWAPNSQAISAITVETMNYFQPDSDLENVDSGYAGVAPGAHYYYR